MTIVPCVDHLTVDQVSSVDHLIQADVPISIPLFRYYISHRYTFPKMERLAQVEEIELREMGFGYRAVRRILHLQISMRRKNSIYIDMPNHYASQQ